ncbi:hypothetical protein WA026_007301 [Henosepilachna vigintioctopunctata]|uniref:Ribosomal RNA-processing protein 8 n=1 Tax=Henosepilachna vigintioctopunctata TaxID=420089 RepID=A0AAW1UTJ0_9CUCU
MKKSFMKFATPVWESTAFGDEMCSNLFKGNERNEKESKKRGIQKGKIHKGRIEKRKSKQKMMTSKELKSVKKANLLKNMESVALMKESNREQKLKQHVTQMKKILSKPKYLIDKVKRTLKKKSDPEKKKILSSSINNSMTEVIASEKNNDRERKNKQKSKKSDSLKKHIDKKIESSLKKFKRNGKHCQSKTASGENENFSKGSETLHQRKNKLPKLESNLSLFSNRIIAPRKNKTCKSLRERMLEKLTASRFRYLNEEIYNMNSKDAQKMFADDPESFKAYHEGYRLQVNSWPLNPVDMIIGDIKKMPKSYIVADFGCGDAKLSREVQQKVHSFDLVATDERVTACDMANVPLKKNSIDVAVFCLSLMGTNIHDYLKEANRVLKIG